ncbi:MAG: hypothetical protein H7175_16895, partial [Burkholderiales bacterium]|nr:hypothetical protein [Anaerolineae bacterium]
MTIINHVEALTSIALSHAHAIGESRHDDLEARLARCAGSLTDRENISAPNRDTLKIASHHAFTSEQTLAQATLRRRDGYLTLSVML